MNQISLYLLHQGQEILRIVFLPKEFLSLQNIPLCKRSNNSNHHCLNQVFLKQFYYSEHYNIFDNHQNDLLCLFYLLGKHKDFQKVVF